MSPATRAKKTDLDKQGYSSAKGRSMLRQMLRLALYKVQNRKRFASVHYQDFVRIRTALQRAWGEDATGKTILEIGCGQWRANVALFSALGHHVIAVDPELPPTTLREYAKVARQHGPQRAVKTWLLEAYLRPRFLRELERLLGQTLRGPSPRLLRTGGEKMPLPDSSVDAVISNNVFEHIADVPAVMREIRRVLRPDGIAHIIVHPFTAFSGGHHLATIAHGGAHRGAPAIPPWDHLRQNRFPSGVYLNRMRLHEYQAIFERHLDTIEWSLRGPEGEDYLTPEIERELSQFTRAELLTGKIDYTGQKAVAPFNDTVHKKLMESVVKALEHAGIKQAEIETVVDALRLAGTRQSATAQTTSHAPHGHHSPSRRNGPNTFLTRRKSSRILTTRARSRIRRLAGEPRNARARASASRRCSSTAHRRSCEPRHPGCGSSRLQFLDVIDEFGRLVTEAPEVPVSSERLRNEAPDPRT